MFTQVHKFQFNVQKKNKQTVSVVYLVFSSFLQDKKKAIYGKN